MQLITAPPPPPSYDRDDVVREITDYYTFLTKMYLPSEFLRIPPPEGWSYITPERYAWLKKTPTVIDLMRHLPYISREENDGHQIYPMTAAVDYEGEQVRRNMRFAEEFGKKSPDLDSIEPDPTTYEKDTSIPEYMLVLASETCGADGFWWLLDTRRGTITLYDWGGQPQLQGKGTIENEPVQEGVNDGELWREHPTWRLKEFLDILKEQYRTLELAPLGPDEVQEKWSGDFGKAQKAVIMGCGWPDLSTYRKDECMKRLKMLMDAHIYKNELPVF